MRTIALTILMTICLQLSAQEVQQNDSLASKKKPKRYNALSMRYHAGRVLQTNDFLKGENESNQVIDYYQALSIAYSVQTDGSKEWHHIFNFPYYGVGFYNANFFNVDELGTPTALYGFMGFPFKRKERSMWGYELGFGLTYNWEPYNKYDNPFNVAIGSYRTVYIDANLFYEYYLSSRWAVRGSFGFTHFSNGGTKKPNSGINLLSPAIEVSYSFKDRPLLIKQPQPAYGQHYEVAIQLGSGSSNVLYDNRNEPSNPGDSKGTADVMHSYLNLSAAVLKQTTWKNKFGAGIDLTYDEKANVVVTNPEDGSEEPIVEFADKFSDKLMLGVYGTYEFTIDRLSVASYLGVLALRKKDNNSNPYLYQKFGLKYHFKNDLYLGLLVRTHNFSVAEVIEWNIGYRIKWH
ncbi:acyloxyacyl hydrolase [Carboxylicivirga mesophila]|uniref:Acyloxyacyl hydrolase n=1 Tax=Carboxylicivirga mesophila TaxID=1166478 RepID=A0ABS5KEN1_9BACT|nr:acyloxyacyl hydrolase [Carboxylicivirga mesophila]MBS2213446.1 acyloxyacyl hydrolase [Carboxylicivirga mesophila]